MPPLAAPTRSADASDTRLEEDVMPTNRRPHRPTTATAERFIGRLIAERRVRFYKVGRYIRFGSRDLDAFVGAGLVEASEGTRR